MRRLAPTRLDRQGCAAGRGLLVLVLVFLFAQAAAKSSRAAPVEKAGAQRNVSSIGDYGATLPSLEHLIRVLTMQDYNTRVVLCGTALLGVAGGIVGTFMLLRKRALVGDVVSHASLPGIAAAFLLVERLHPGGGRSTIALLAGALMSGLVAMGIVLIVRRNSRIKEDAALAIVLSVFFGLGIALFTVVQRVPTGNLAGLQGFIFGKAASMIAADVYVFVWVGLAVLVVCLLLFKEFSLLCFDDAYAAAHGWSITGLDLVLMALVAVVTVIGIQSVGLLLVVAMLLIPPVSARFWTDHLPTMTLLAALIGGASALVGVILSALFPRLAAGAVIVLAGFGFFLVSMLASPRRGLVLRVFRHQALSRRVGQQHLLRACYEYLEADATQAAEGGVATERSVSVASLLSMRGWSDRSLRHELARAARVGLVQLPTSDRLVLTEAGIGAARRVARNHRMWELYLIQHADIAPGHVDRYADIVEHVLEPELIDQLEDQLQEKYPQMYVPPSPHELAPAGGMGGDTYEGSRES